MANLIYPKFRQAKISGGTNCDLLNGTLKLVLVDSGAYTYNAAHEFLSDIPSGARIATGGAITGKATTNGVLTGTVPAFTSVSGVQSENVVLIVDTGAEGTSRLVNFWDTATGLPITPNGANINVTVSTNLGTY